MKTYVFPGQGSQIKGMGEDLFVDFADLTKKADEILGYSIKELCLNNPEQKLFQTRYTQPAMYVVNALSYMKKKQDSGESPDYLAGHSLGEYNALQAAGVFSFESGLKLVKKRGELMSKVRKGAMAAILNSSEKQIREILEKANLAAIDLANHNAPSQIVISGLEEDVIKSQSYFEQENATFIPLNTSGAFHSRYMKEVGVEYAKYIKRFKFSKPHIPVISNVTAKPYASKKIAQSLIDQITHCVRWSDSIRFLLDQGITEFEEMGVGDVLTKLIDYIREEWTSGKQDAQDRSGQKSESVSDENDIARLDHLKIEIKHDISISAHEMVERWNNNYPIGTRTCSDLYETEFETRTEAMLLFGHRAAVYMEGYNGYFDLREVAPVEYSRRKPIIFMFSGQGSHYYHMGKELYQNDPIFKKWLDKADDVALPIYGKSIIGAIYDESKKKTDPFEQALEASAAIVILGYAMAKFLIEKGIKPDYLLGTSLGEITASIVGGGVDLHDALLELSKQLALFAKKCEPGKMIGILDNSELYHKNNVLNELSELAAIDSKSHFVVSCHEKYTMQIEHELTAQNIVFQTVPVSFAYHSSLLDPAEIAFKEMLANTPFRSPAVPLISCAHADTVNSVNVSYFWDIYRQPIRFQETIQMLLKQQDCIFLDAGPSGTLSNFVKYNLSKESRSKSFPILTPFGKDVANLEIIQQYFESANDERIRVPLKAAV